MVKIKAFHSLEEVCGGGVAEGHCILGATVSWAQQIKGGKAFLVLPGKLVNKRLKLAILFCALL